MAEQLPSVGPVCSTGDREREERLNTMAEATLFERSAQRSGAVMASSVLVRSSVPQQLPPALQLWHRAGPCLSPELLPAPLPQQLLPQPRESSMAAGTSVSGAHLQSVPCPWLRACGSAPCYAGGSQMVPLNRTLFFAAEAAVP